MEPAELLEDNLNQVRERIDQACRRAGRSGDSVTLVVVTKSVSPEAMRLLWRLGVRDIGENRVQEALRKAEALEACGFCWHMVGHLQRDKVKAALGLFEWIHSVDSMRLADEIQMQADKQGRTARVLVEVNVSGEGAKYGVARDEARALVEHISTLEALSLEGMITGEHGIGATRRNYLPLALSDAQIDVMRGIKAVFDPNRILNPAKIFP